MFENDTEKQYEIEQIVRLRQKERQNKIDKCMRLANLKSLLALELQQSRAMEIILHVGIIN